MRPSLIEVGLCLLCLFALPRLWAQIDPQPLRDSSLRFLGRGIYSQEYESGKFRYGFYTETAQEQKIAGPAAFDSIVYREFPKQTQIPSFYEVRRGDKWGLLHADQSPWLAIEYQALNFDHKRKPAVIHIKKDDKFGLCLADGQMILEAKYEEILFDGFVYKVQEQGKWGLLDSLGQTLLPSRFEAIYDNRQNLENSVLVLNNRFSLLRWIKNRESFEIQQSYEELYPLHGHYLVREKNLWGMVDTAGQIKIPLEYQGLGLFGSRNLPLVLAKKDKKFGLFEIDGPQIKPYLPIEYDDIWLDKIAQAIVLRKGKFKDFYQDGKILFDFAYNDLSYHASYEDKILNVFLVKQGKNWGIIDAKTKRFIAQPKYQRVVVLSGDNFLVQQKNLWGMIGRRGQSKIPITYVSFEFDPQSNKLFMTHKDGQTLPFILRDARQ